MKIAVIGLGKIGASLCADLSSLKIASEVTGVDTDGASVDYCVSKGIVDRGFTEAENVPPDVEICVLAVPVDFMEEAARKFFSVSRPATVLTDVGSVKGAVIENVSRCLPAGAPFVPAHPIAGDEKHGARSFSTGIFRGNPVIITGGEGKPLLKVEQMWKKTGARIIKMKPEQHDRLFAFLSHLPHVCAYSLASAAACANGEKSSELFSLSGGGLEDATRIAMSDPEMWAGIFLQNSAHIQSALEVFSGLVSETTEAIRTGNRERLTEILSGGRAAKALFIKHDAKKGA